MNMEILLGNAVNKILKQIEKQYSLFKTLIVIDDENEEKYYDIVQKLKSKSRKCEIVSMPINVKCKDIISGLINEQYSDDVGAIIVVGSNTSIMKVVTDYNTTIINIITQPYLPLFMYHQDYLVIDDGIMSGCSYRTMAKCYGIIASLGFYLLEQVFNKAIFYSQIDSEKMIEIEKCLQNLTMLPSLIIKNNLGKHIIVNMCLQLKELITLDDITSSFVFKLANNIVDQSKYKNINMGEALIIASVVGYKMMSVLLSANVLKPNIGFDCEKRIKIYMNNNDFSLTKISQSFICDEDIESHIDNFNKVKSVFNSAFLTYFDMTSKHIKTFKELYYDRCVILNKFLNEKNLLQAINSIPETYSINCFATFIRDVGLLNKF